jgi:agmatine deiminase
VKKAVTGRSAPGVARVATPKEAAAPPVKKKRETIEVEFSRKTPRQLHFRMPAEWETHFGTWMTWPNKKGISFPGKGAYDAVVPTLLSMIRALITSEEVFVNVSSEEDKQLLRDGLTIAEQRHLHLVEVPSMEPWCRDHGCTFLVRNHDKAGGAVVWKFNAWGGKYDKAMADSGIALKMAKYLGGKVFDPGIVLEGGSIEVNGTGTVLTTESCLLNKNRNRGQKSEDIERILKDHLGVSNVLWLPGGLEGDDTDGHVDDLTRFVNRDTVVTAVEENPRDKNHDVLQHNLERLEGMTIEDGTPLKVVPIPMPQAIVRKGQRLPASYANFYIANKIVLLPTFDDAGDEKALEIMVKSFPTRRIYPIDCRDVVWGLGAFHCLTQQVPLAAFPKVLDLIHNPPPAPRPVY